MITTNLHLKRLQRQSVAFGNNIKSELIDALKATNKAKRGDKLDKKDIHELLGLALDRGLIDANYELLVEIPEGSVKTKLKAEPKVKVAPVEPSVYKSVKTSLK